MLCVYRYISICFHTITVEILIANFIFNKDPNILSKTTYSNDFSIDMFLDYNMEIHSKYTFLSFFKMAA